MKKRKLVNEKTHRLFIQIRDKQEQPRVLSNGKTIIPTKWVEVQEIDIGSCKIPNKEILNFRFEPIRENPDKWFEHYEE